MSIVRFVCLQWDGIGVMLLFSGICGKPFSVGNLQSFTKYLCFLQVFHWCFHFGRGTEREAIKNSVMPYLLLIIKLRFTCGERKIW